LNVTLVSAKTILLNTLWIFSFKKHSSIGSKTIKQKLPLSYKFQGWTSPLLSYTKGFFACHPSNTFKPLSHYKVNLERTCMIITKGINQITSNSLINRCIFCLYNFFIPKLIHKAPLVLGIITWLILIECNPIIMLVNKKLLHLMMDSYILSF